MQGSAEQFLGIVVRHSLQFFLTILLYSMPQKKHNKTKGQSSPHKKTKNSSRIDSKIKEIKHKRGVSPIRHKASNRLFQSVGALSFQNKKIKNVLSQKSEPKSTTQRDISTGIFQEMRPNRQYYGQETSVYINKYQSSSNIQFSHRAGKSKGPKKDQKVNKILKTYRTLQRSHSEQLDAYSRSVSKKELHRLRRIQEYELRQQMQKLVTIEQKALGRRR